MMRNKVKKATAIGCLLVSLCVLCVPAGAQEPDLLPQYAVAFNTSQGVHVASLLSNETWRIDTLPRGVMFGQIDMMNCMPIWSSDGHRVYVMVEPEVSKPGDYETIIMSQIAVYDITTQTFEILADVLDAEAIVAEENRIYTGYMIKSVSPDEHYAWLTSTLREEDALLVDLQTGEVLYRHPLPVKIVVWHPSLESVFVAAEGIFHSVGNNDQFIQFLPNYEFIEFVTRAEGAEQQSVTNALWSGNNVFLFAADTDSSTHPQVIGWVGNESAASGYLDTGHILQAADQDYASYVNTAGELIVLDIPNWELHSLGPAGLYTGWHEGNMLLNITVPGEGDAYDVILTVTDFGNDGESTEEGIAQDVPRVSRIQVSPDGQRLRLDFVGGDISLYDRRFGLLVDSEVSTPDGPVTLQDYEASMIWGEQYTYFSLWPPTSTGIQSVAIPPKGDPLFAPSGHVWAGESPDGDWTLLVGAQGTVQGSQNPHSELLAYSLQTGETVSLFAQPGEHVSRSGAGPVAYYTFAWSPMLE